MSKQSSLEQARRLQEKFLQEYKIDRTPMHLKELERIFMQSADKCDTELVVSTKKLSKYKGQHY